MKNKREIVVPTNDYVFSRIFGRVGNERITKSLISTIIDDKIEKISLSESKILERDLMYDKMGILDVMVKVNGKVPIDIEMQVVKQC